jgi:hypothetical protein
MAVADGWDDWPHRWIARQFTNSPIRQLTNSSILPLAA